MNARRPWRVLWALLLAAVLSGCASQLVVESVVQAQATWASAPQNARWRFERLPSQQAQPELQSRYEGMVAPLLERAGWQRDEQNPSHLVQVLLRSSAWQLLPWPGHFGFWHRLRPPFVERTQYLREVVVLIRERQSGQIVYEAHANHDSLWPDSDAQWSAMLTAAMHGFPNPPQGSQAVGVQVRP